MSLIKTDGAKQAIGSNPFNQDKINLNKSNQKGKKQASKHQSKKKKDDQSV